MVVETKAIVISTIKFGDTSIIAKCYTEKEGLKSYILKGILKSKKGKLKIAYFQPLTQLRMTATHNTKGKLNTIKEVVVTHHYTSFYHSVTKQTIAMFLSEILSYAIHEEEENLILFKYLETSLIWLDTHDEVSNFHLLFLLNLTKFLGFYPKVLNKEATYFDLVEGEFTNRVPKYAFISNDKLFLFKKLLGTNFDKLHEINFSAENRQDILSVLIQYFGLHLEGFRRPKSLDVLKTVFS